MEHTILKNRINMSIRLEETKNDMINKILGITTKNGWYEKTKKTLEELDLLNIDYLTQKQKKMKVKDKIETMMKERIDGAARTKSKIEFLISNKERRGKGERSLYMMKMNRFDASIIFKARTRMLDIKNNFRGKYDLKCRACGTTEETQEHILEQCKIIHREDSTTVAREDIFTEDLGTLEETAKKVKDVMERIQSAVHTSAHSGDLEEGT